MESNKQKVLTLELMYSDKKLNNFEYDINTCVKDLKNFIVKNYSIPILSICLKYDNKMVEDDNIILSKILLTNLSKLSGEKLKVRIIPQIHLNPVYGKFLFLPFEKEGLEGSENIDPESIDKSEENPYIFSLNFDLVVTKVCDFKKEIFDLFTKKLAELHYNLDHRESEFFDTFEEQALIFKDSEGEAGLIGKYLFNPESDLNKFTKYFFMIKNSSVHFYSHAMKGGPSENSNIPSNTIELRKTISSGQQFKIILHTYNSTVMEIDVYPEMKISELKDEIERILGIRKNYQELIYLVYKLKDDEKMLKDYYIRPQGIIFLRGFFFPIIFTDFYNKNMRNMIGVNVAERVYRIRQEIINKLGLNYSDFKLVSNGRELDDEKFLIDYNIQKMQNIYIK